MVEHAQNLGHGHRARTGRGEAAHLVHHPLGPMVKTQGLTFHGTVLAQVLQAQQAGVVRVVLHFFHHGLCDGALVKSIGAFQGNLLQHLGQTGVL